MPEITDLIGAPGRTGLPMPFGLSSRSLGRKEPPAGAPLTSWG